MELRSISPQEEVAESIKVHFKKNGIKLEEVARQLGIAGPSLSYHLKGDKYLNYNIAHKLSGLYNFSLDYLLLGKGSLIIPTKDSLDNDKEHVLDDPIAVRIGRELEKKLREMQSKIDEITGTLKELQIVQSNMTALVAKMLDEAEC